MAQAFHALQSFGLEILNLRMAGKRSIYNRAMRKSNIPMASEYSTHVGGSYMVSEKNRKTEEGKQQEESSLHQRNVGQ